MPFHNNRKTLTHTHTHTISLFPNPDYFLKTILTLLSSFHSSCLQTLPLTSTIKKTSRIPKQKWTCRACAVTRDTTQNKRKKFKRYTPGEEEEKHQRSWWKAQGDVDYEKSCSGNAERWMSVLSSSSSPPSLQILFFFPFFFFSFLLHRTDLAPLPELMELIFSLLPFLFIFLFKKGSVSHPACVQSRGGHFPTGRRKKKKNERFRENRRLSKNLYIRFYTWNLNSIDFSWAVFF